MGRDVRKPKVGVARQFKAIATHASKIAVDKPKGYQTGITTGQNLISLRFNPEKNEHLVVTRLGDLHYMEDSDLRPINKQVPSP